MKDTVDVQEGVTLLLPIEKTIRSRNVVYATIAIVTGLVILAAFLEKSDQPLPAPTLAYASCFVLTIYFLRNRMASLFDILLTSAGTTFSGLWLYEVFYHFWGTNPNAIKYDFSSFSIVLYPGWAFPVYFAAVLILIPFLKKQYISLNVPLVSVFAISIAIFAMWAAMAYPHSLGTSASTAVGYGINSASYILAVVPAFLFCEWGRIRLRRKVVCA